MQAWPRSVGMDLCTAKGRRGRTGAVCANMWNSLRQWARRALASETGGCLVEEAWHPLTLEPFSPAALNKTTQIPSPWASARTRSNGCSAEGSLCDTTDVPLTRTLSGAEWRVKIIVSKKKKKLQCIKQHLKQCWWSCSGVEPVLKIG